MRNYTILHDKIASWMHAGKIPNMGRVSNRFFTDFDVFVLKTLDQYLEEYEREHPNSIGWYSSIQLTSKLAAGLVNYDWLFGPHGLTLFKVLMIKKGYLKDDKNIKQNMIQE